MLELMLVNALYYSWEPKYYKYMKAKENEKHDDETLKLLSIASFGSCALILFSDWIGYVLGSESFHRSLYLIPLIVLGQFLLAINPIYKRHISFAKKTIYTSLIVLVAGATNIWLNSIYIPKFGAAAGAYTTIFSYLIMLLLTFFTAKHLIRLHVTPLGNIAKRVLVVVSVCSYYYLDLYYLDLNIFFQVLLKFGVLLLSGLLLLWNILLSGSGRNSSPKI